MTPKPVVPREPALQDVRDALDFYLAEASAAVALRFVQALERTYRSIGRHPGIGSSRYGHELDIPGLRTRAVRGFPHIVFYIELSEAIDVWRVLHARRDIPAWIGGSGAG